jgi:hypothetical protein
MNVACGGRGGDNSKDTKINRGGDDVILQCATVFFIRIALPAFFNNYILMNKI